MSTPVFVSLYVRITSGFLCSLEVSTLGSECRVLKRLTILFFFGQYDTIMQSCWNPNIVENGFLSFVLTISGGSSGLFFLIVPTRLTFFSSNFLASNKLVKKLS